MALLVLAAVAVAGLAAGWWLDRRRLARRLASARGVGGLPTEVVLWLRDRADDLPDGGAARRSTERARLLCAAVGIEPAEVLLAAALPTSAASEPGLHLPAGARQALVMRHARWDGTGVPPVAGAAIPPAAQVLALVEWLDAREGTAPETLAAELRAEAGKRFSPAFVEVVLDELGTLRAVRGAGFATDFRIARGALICAVPEGVDAERRPAALADAAARLRRMLRPRDRVETTAEEVVVWLRDADAEGALAVLARVRPALRALPIEGVDVGGVGFRYGVAVAGADASRFAQLLVVARSRCRDAA
ncbi:MAG: hypothetical protein ACOZNI_31350 [Myxococcota bacterium]